MAQNIAIVGIGCRLPGGIDRPSKFWDFLINEHSAKSTIPPSRFNKDAFYHPNANRPGSINSQEGYFIDKDYRLFENGFFGINNLEAKYMDPQQRILLEVVYECFESAGLTLEAAAGSNTGCYVGNFTTDFLLMQGRDPEYFHRYSATGMGTTLLSNRISHVFDLKGPSMVLDTACSSSLYSLHLACTAITNGECEAAVVAGANLIMSPQQHMGTVKAGFISPTSQCHTFDIAADGYARAEGIGAVYLKGLEDAVRDGDPIRAVILGTATNSNGKTAGISLPSSEAQADVIRRAHRRAGLSDMTQISYVETHGTGTAVGDPLEVSTLLEVFGGERSASAPLLIGGVKPNLGHSEAASGLTGLIKLVLAMENCILPATIGITQLNPRIPLGNGKIRVVRQAEPWTAEPGGILMAGLNSFGYGGANSHAVIASNSLSYNNAMNSTDYSDALHLLPFSATSISALEARLNAFYEARSRSSTADFAYTLGVRRTHLPVRGYIIASDVTHLSPATQPLSVLRKSEVRGLPRDLAFVFTGQGAQWPGMARELMRLPLFRETISELETVLSEAMPPPQWSLTALLTDPELEHHIDDASVSQPLCTAIQIALVRLLRSWNIHPKAVMGHSSGEIAAAFTAGKLSARQALEVAYYRGYAVGNCNNASGKMLAAGLGGDEATQILKDHKFPGVTVACFNSPASVTFSGDASGVERLKAHLDERNFFVRALNTNGQAYHSSHMSKAGELYAEKLGKTLARDRVYEQGNEDVPWISSVTGEKMVSYPGAEYWRKNLESPVVFAKAAKKLVQQPYEFIELGPHATLRLPLKQIWEDTGCGGKSYEYLSCLKKGHDSERTILELAGSLFVQGHNISFPDVNNRSKGTVIPDLPPYQWTYDEPKWSEPRLSYEFRNRPYPRHELLGSRCDGGTTNEATYRNILRVTDVPWLGDHKLDDTAVFPAAGYLAIAMEAFQQINGIKNGVTITQVTISQPLELGIESSPGVEIITSLRPKALTVSANFENCYHFSVQSLDGQEGGFTQHCSGWITEIGENIGSLDNADSLLSNGTRENTVDGHLSASNCSKEKQWYEKLRTSGLNYGPGFQAMGDIHAPANEGTHSATSIVSLLREYPYSPLYSSCSYAVHPITLDACLQTALIATCAGDLTALRAKVPVSLETCNIRLTESTDMKRLAQATAISSIPAFGKTTISTTLTAKSGVKVAELLGVTVADYNGNRYQQETADRFPCLRVQWKPDPSLLTDRSLAYLEKYLERGPSLTPPTLFQRFLNLTDIFVHKNPDMNILDLSGSPIQSKLVADLLWHSQPLQKCRKYILGQMRDGEGIQYAQYHDGKTIPPEDFRAQFDLIIIPDDDLTTKWLSSGLLQPLLAEDGTVLACGRIFPESSIKIRSIGDTGLALGKMQSSPRVYGSRRVLIVEPNTRCSIAESLEIALKQSGFSSQRCTFSSLVSSNSTNDSIIVSLAELDSSLLASASEVELAGFKHLTNSASSLLWVTGCKDSTPEFSVMPALARSLLHEQPGCKICVLETDTTGKMLVESIVSTVEFVSDPGSTDLELKQREGLIHVSRFVPDGTLNKRFMLHNQQGNDLQTIEATFPARLYIDLPGVFDTLYFEKSSLEPVQLKPDHVEVEVVSIGLNAKDVYVLTGRFSTKNNTCSLECSGTVIRVGAHVTSLVPGDRVAALAPGHFQQLEHIPHWACVKITNEETFEEMASVPVVYSTALYALQDRARLTCGESILIHSAAGGVGLAAITVAKLLGSEIYVTVGSHDKQKFLVEKFGISPDHIYSSRDTSFVGAVKQKTAGRGVDVILNSLSGELLHASWECCAPFGRFIEIGKRDILDGGQLDMKTFSRGATFSAFDLSDLFWDSSHAASTKLSSLLRDAVRTYREAKASQRPLIPITVFGAGEVEKAFRYFSVSTRVGKIVVNFAEKQSMIKVRLPPYNAIFPGESAYLLVGCLGGLGRSLCRWMFNQGARKFVHLSRSGLDKDAAKALVRELQDAGAQVQVIRGSVTNYRAVKEAVDACGPHMKGIVQGAMALKESLFSEMSADTWRYVLDPKIQGTWNLHNASIESGAELDFMLLLSSISGSVGTATESNYCAANSFLDSFAAYRCRLGLPVTSLGLGMISGAGYLHENPDIESLLLRRGIHPLTEQEFLQVVDLAIASQEPTSEQDTSLDGKSHILTGLEPFGFRELWNRGFDVQNPTMDDPRASILVHNLQQHPDSQKYSRSQQISSEGDVLELVRHRFSNLVLLPVEKLSDEIPLSKYGMDSMLAAEFRTWFHKSLGVDIAFFNILSKGATLQSLATAAYKRLSEV